MMTPRKKQRRLRFVLGLGALGALVATGGSSLWILMLDIPDLRAFDTRLVAESTKIYDRTGNVLLFDIHDEVRRTIVPFEQIPAYVKNATVAIEDDRFYQHKGVSPLSIFRALIVNLKSGGVQQGGSTITQQLVKNTFLSAEQTLTRKLKEFVLALKIERVLSKDDILYLYLNEIPYGSNLYGIEAASEGFFGKHATELTLAESAYLASLPKAPTYYSPDGNHREQLEERKNLVLSRMAALGYITEDDMRTAQAERVAFIPRGDESIKAPHFVFYVRELLEKKFGGRALAQSGLRVITTLDWSLQERAETMVKNYVDEIEEKFNASNAALVGLDPKTGQILVLVGSRDWFGPPSPEGCAPGVDCRFEPQVNVAVFGKGRQPGSSIKPIVYATAFKKGYTPDTMVFDLPTEFNSSCGPDGTPKPETGVAPKECYHPENYDEVFRGPVPLRNALAQSINVPSVKTLYLAGLTDSLKTAKDLGITTLTDPARYGLTLVLGGGEVHLLELAGAYGVFANDGERNPLAAILRIEDAQGRVLEEFSPSPRRALDPNIARMVSDVLSDEEARAPAFGQRSYLYVEGRDVAVKTGTTNDYRDAWVIGYAPNFALGLWIGNNNNAAMEKRVAGFIAAPLWNAFFKAAIASFPKEDFGAPDIPQPEKPILRGVWEGGKTYVVDTVSGKRATEFTPEEYREERVVRETHSVLHWVDKNNPTGPAPSHPEEDPQYALWEAPVRAWATEHGIRDQSPEDIPSATDDVHMPEYQPVLEIRSPKPDTVFLKSDVFPALFAASGRFRIRQIDVFLGNRYLGSARSSPYGFMVNLADVPGLGAQETLRVTVYDEKGNSATKTILIRFAGGD